MTEPDFALLRPPVLGHYAGMARRKKAAPRQKKATDAERVRFIAPPGSNDFYEEVAALEGIRVDAWIRTTLHAAAVRVLEAHGRDLEAVPPVHLKRPPRLQPRMDKLSGGEES